MGEEVITFSTFDFMTHKIYEIRGKNMADGFSQFCARLAQIDLFGTAGMALPQGTTLAKAIRDAAPLLPPLYEPIYVTHLESRLKNLLQKAPGSVETMTGVVYQHAGSTHQPLDRFLAVISDLYRSFLDKDKRTNAGVPLAEAVPPLAMFQHDGSSGPFTIPIDDVANLIGGSCGVVSMPATYAENPIIWAALAHETGGHDVTHADAGLLEQLAAGIGSALAGLPNQPGISRDDFASLWAYWIDEASADVYGLLNCGPEFELNLAAFFGALNARATGGVPSLRMESGFSDGDSDQILDPHPTDILRLSLGVGVIQSLSGLSSVSKSSYIEQITEIGKLLGNGDTVTIAGNIPASDNTLQPFQVKLPLDFMHQAAISVGGFIASAKLKALNGHSIQDIETWDDADEARAQSVKAALLASGPISPLGDDAQLLAGATLALIEKPDIYNQVTQALNDGLDRSFQLDPIWGTPPADATYIRYAKNLTLHR